MTTHFWAVPPIGTPAIQIDINPEALGRNYPLLAAVNGDAKVTLARMLAAADRGSAGMRKVWIEETRRICAEWRGGKTSPPRSGPGAGPPPRGRAGGAPAVRPPPAPWGGP